tara:strand:+ start:2136 stop:3548 length:1413 start_codon:yes stop_codon:yes gene_type:complete
LLIKSFKKKGIFLIVIIFSPILFGQIKSDQIDRTLKESTEKNKFYQISSLARSTAVEIILPLKLGYGSGVIIERKDSQYSVLTAMHIFEDIDEEIPITIRTADYSFYKVNKENIQQIENLDLAIFTFKTDKEYETANFSNLSTLKKDDVLFSSGFVGSTFYLQKGKLVASSNLKVKDGNQLIYTSKVVPGMSGGGIFDNYGKLVGINTMSNSKSFQDKSFSYSLGVPNSFFIDFINGNPFVYSEELITVDDYLVKSTELSNGEGNSKLIINLLDKKPKLFDGDSYSASSWYFYHRLCLANSDLNDNNSALKNCLNAIQIQPLDSIALLNYGIAQSKMNDDYGAISTFNRYLKIDPNKYSFLLYRALSKGKIRDLKGGLFDLNRAIDIEPEKEEAYLIRAFFKGELKDYYGAISDYNISIAINPKEGQSFFYRGIMKEKIYDRKGACADSRKALSLGYKNVDNQKLIKKNC